MKGWKEIVLFSVLAPAIIGLSIGFCSAKHRAEAEHKSVWDGTLGSIDVRKAVVERAFLVKEHPGGKTRNYRMRVVEWGENLPVYEIWDWHDVDPKLEKGKHIWYRISGYWAGHCCGPYSKEDCAKRMLEFPEWMRHNETVATWVWGGGGCVFRANEQYLAELHATAERLRKAQEDYEGEAK